jgi:hypothetical protein
VGAVSLRFYTRKDIAGLLQMSESWVKKQTLSGALPCFYFGTACRVTEEQLQGFLQRNNFPVVKIVGRTNGDAGIPPSPEHSQVLVKFGGIR